MNDDPLAERRGKLAAWLGVDHFEAAPPLASHLAALLLGGVLFSRWGDATQPMFVAPYLVAWPVIGFFAVHAALATRDVGRQLGVATIAATLATLFLLLVLDEKVSAEAFTIWVFHLLYAASVYLPGAAVAYFARRGDGPRLSIASVLVGTLLIAALAALLRIAPGAADQLELYVFGLAPSAVLAWAAWFAASARSRHITAHWAPVVVVAVSVIWAVIRYELDQAGFFVVLFAGQALVLWSLFSWRERMLLRRRPADAAWEAAVFPLGLGELAEGDAYRTADADWIPQTPRRDWSAIAAKLTLAAMVATAMLLDDSILGLPRMSARDWAAAYAAAYVLLWGAAAGIVALAAAWAAQAQASVAIRTAAPCAAVFLATLPAILAPGLTDAAPQSAVLFGLVALGVFCPLFLQGRLTGGSGERSLSIAHLIVGTLAIAGLLTVGRHAFAEGGFAYALLVGAGPLSALAYVALAVARQRACGVGSPPLLLIAAVLHSLIVLATSTTLATESVITLFTPLTFAIAVGWGLSFAAYREAVLPETIISPALERPTAGRSEHTAPAQRVET